MSCHIVMHKLLNEDRSADLVNLRIKEPVTMKNALKFSDTTKGTRKQEIGIKRADWS